MVKSIKSISIYTTTGFPYGMAAENFIRQVALGIRENNVNVRVVKLCGENPRNAAPNDTKIEVSNLFLKRRLNGFPSIINILVIPFIIPFSLIKHRIKFGTDVVILYGIHFAYWGAPLIIFCRIFGLKVYSIETERYIRKYFGKEWWKYPRWLLYRLQFGFFDKLLNGKICLSSYLIKDAISRGMNPKKLRLIPHFIDTDFFANQKTYANINHDIFTIGYSGAIYSLNGIFILIKAFKQFLLGASNSQLVLIGTVHSDEIEELEAMLFGIKEHVVFPGMVPAKDVPMYLKACNVLVNPREQSVLSDSGFPTKVGEYLSSGAVVISSKTGDLDTYFKDKLDILYFESGNYDELKDKLQFVYKNREDSIIIAKNGQDKAKKYLDYRASSKMLCDFINQSY